MNISRETAISGWEPCYVKGCGLERHHAEEHDFESIHDALSAKRSADQRLELAAPEMVSALEEIERIALSPGDANYSQHRLNEVLYVTRAILQKVRR
jgi:hypothetical protein